MGSIFLVGHAARHNSLCISVLDFRMDDETVNISMCSQNLKLTINYRSILLLKLKLEKYIWVRLTLVYMVDSFYIGAVIKIKLIQTKAIYYL